MNYALNFTGAGHVTVPTLSGSTALGRIFRADVELSNYTTQFLFGESTANTNSSARINSATQIAVRIASGSTRTVTLPAGSIPLNTRLVIEGWKVAGPLLEIRIDGVAVGSTAIGAIDVTTPMTINYIGIGASTTARFVGKMYELDLFGNTFLNTDQPTATTWGTGTLVGFPTDGTQWTPYGGATTPIAFSGTIPAQIFTNGQAVSVDLSTYFTGSLTPFTFARTGSALTGTGLSITSAGLLAGTATTGSVTGVTITGTDTGSNAAVSNAFNVTVNAATPVAFSGTVPDQTGAVGTPYSLDLSTYFSGSLTPFTYFLLFGDLTGTGLSLNTSTGVISGTPTGAANLDLQVRATDTGTNTAVTNLFALDITATTPVSFTGTIPAITGTQNAAITPVDTSTYFSGSLTPFTYSLFSGTLPAGVTLNSSTGVISGTPTVSFSGNIVVRATDTGSNTADSNSISVTIAAAAGTFTTGVLRRRVGGGVVANTAMTYFRLYNPTTGALVLNRTDLSSDANGRVTCTDAALTAGVEYKADWLAATGETRMSKKAAT